MAFNSFRSSLLEAGLSHQPLLGRPRAPLCGGVQHLELRGDHEGLAPTFERHFHMRMAAT